MEKKICVSWNIWSISCIGRLFSSSHVVNVREYIGFVSPWSITWWTSLAKKIFYSAYNYVYIIVSVIYVMFVIVPCWSLIGKKRFWFDWMIDNTKVLLGPPHEIETTAPDFRAWVQNLVSLELNITSSGCTSQDTFPGKQKQKFP